MSFFVNTLNVIFILHFFHFYTFASRFFSCFASLFIRIVSVMVLVAFIVFTIIPIIIWMLILILILVIVFGIFFLLCPHYYEAIITRYHRILVHLSFGWQLNHYAHFSSIFQLFINPLSDATTLPDQCAWPPITCHLWDAAKPLHSEQFVLCYCYVTALFFCYLNVVSGVFCIFIVIISK